MRMFFDVSIDGDSGRIRNGNDFECTFQGDSFRFDCLDIPEKKNLLELCKAIRKIAKKDVQRPPEPEKTIEEIIFSLIEAKKKGKPGFKKTKPSENDFSFIIGRTCRVLKVAEQKKVINFLGLIGSDNPDTDMIIGRGKKVSTHSHDVFIYGRSIQKEKAHPGYGHCESAVWQHRIMVQY